MKAPVVVLRSNDYCFLGILRGLRAVGASVQVVTFDWDGAGPWYSEASRHFASPEVIPNPFEFPEQAAAAMEALGKRLVRETGERPMAIPSSDTNLVFLLDHAEQLSPYFRTMGSPDFDTFRFDAFHKGLCAEILGAAGVALPATLRCQRPEQIAEVAKAIPYPCVYKPAVKDYGQTFYRLHGGLKAVECVDAAELSARLAVEMDRGFDLVVQEKLLFDTAADEIPVYVYADREHRIRMACCGVKEQLEHPPYGTATILRLSFEEEVLPLAERVVEALGWRGILMIEFTRTQPTRAYPDGRLELVEINCRPWLFVDFYRRCGFNFLGALVGDLVGDTSAWPACSTPSREQLRASPVHIALPEAAAPHLEAAGREIRRAPVVDDVSAWLGSVSGERSLTYLDPDDPEPGRRELAQMAADYGFDAAALRSAVAPLLSAY